MKSEDGNTWSTVTELDVEGIVSEADLNFMDDSLYICIRKDEPTGAPSYWGVAKCPYNVFEWKVMDRSIACPEFFVIPETNQMWITGREYIVEIDGTVRGIRIPLYAVDTSGNLELVKVVSDGGVWDQGYPSLCRIGEKLYHSYYQVTDDTYSKSVIRVAEFNLINN